MSQVKWKERFEIKPGRWVYVPTEETTSIGLIIKARLEKFWRPPNYFYHFQPGGHIKLVNQAKKYSYFSLFDFEYFFSQITKNRIIRCLKHYVSYENTYEIAKQSTVRYGENLFSLPYGFPQSSILASMVLDNSRLGKYLRKVNLSSVFMGIYVDDILFASNNPHELEELSNIVCQYATASNFNLNRRKGKCCVTSLRAFNLDISVNALSVHYDRYSEFVERVQTDPSERAKTAIIRYVELINDSQASYLSLLKNSRNK